MLGFFPAILFLFKRRKKTTSMNWKRINLSIFQQQILPHRQTQTYTDTLTHLHGHTHTLIQTHTHTLTYIDTLIHQFFFKIKRL